MLVAILCIAAVALVAVFSWLGRTMNRTRAENLANAPRILDETFAGAPQATYTVGLATLQFEEVVEGAAARGYKLTSQSGESVKTLVFERVA